MKEPIKSRVYVLNDFLQRGYNIKDVKQIQKQYDTTLSLNIWRLCCFLDMMRIQKGDVIYTYADNLPKIDLQKMAPIVYSHIDKFIPDVDKHCVFEFASNSTWYKSSKILSIISPVSFQNKKMKEAIGDHIFSASVYLINEGLEATFLKDHLRVYLKPNGACGFITKGDQEWIKEFPHIAELLYAICGNILSTIITISCSNTTLFKHNAPKSLNKKRKKKDLSLFNNYKSIKYNNWDMGDYNKISTFVLKNQSEKGVYVLDIQ